MGDQLARAMAGIPQQHFDAAKRQMFLSPQEQDLYQRHLSNLWGSGGVDNPNGSRSSLYQMSTTGPDGQTYNLPTVYDGKILSPDAAYGRAQQQGLSSFPAYPTTDAAESRYDQMHQFMDRDTGDWMNVRRFAPMYPTLADDSPQNANLAALLAGKR